MEDNVNLVKAEITHIGNVGHLCHSDPFNLHTLSPHAHTHTHKYTQSTKKLFTHTKGFSCNKEWVAAETPVEILPNLPLQISNIICV